MFWQVRAELVGETGDTMWGYARSESVPLPTDPKESQEVVLQTGAKLLDSIDEAKEAISAQVRAEAQAGGSE